jgi:hypothetical protein
MLVVADGTASEDPTSDDIVAWVKEMDDRGIRLLGNRVVSPDEATTVQVRDGEVLLTDGPYAETREQMAGFDIVECTDLDQAIEVAAQHPMARYGRIEVRPFWQE